jgi:hypothetical protein
MNASRLAALACAAAAFSAPAPAAVLYKSIGPNGVIQFSDQPPERGQANVVAEIQMKDTQSGPLDGTMASGPSREEPLREDDEAVQRANAQVDLAEHALAEVRRVALPASDPMRLQSARVSRADAERIDFYKKNVLLAHQNLLEVLQQKRKADARVTYTASSDWAPIKIGRYEGRTPPFARMAESDPLISPAGRR